MRALSTLLIASLVLGAATASADDYRGDRHKTFTEVRQGHNGRESFRIAQNNGPTLAQAIQMVRRQYQGRIVGAETEIRGNREVHRIRVLTKDGKVRTVNIPGRTLSKGRR